MKTNTMIMEVSGFPVSSHLITIKYTHFDDVFCCGEQNNGHTPPPKHVPVLIPVIWKYVQLHDEKDLG